MFDLVIRNAKIVLPEKTIEGDIAIDGERISKIGRNLRASKEIDVRGRHVLPGLIDVHVHFREPGASFKEDWMTGSSAAAAGGVTTVFDMPNTQPPTITRELLDEKRKAFACKSTVDFGFHFGASTGNIKELKKVERVASVKFYLGSTTGSLLVESDAVLYEELAVLAKRHMIASAHAEDEGMIKALTQKLRDECRMDAMAYAEARPPAAAAEAAEKIISLAKLAKNSLHLCHVSTKEEIGVIETNKKEMNLTAEASPHHLFLTREDYKRLGPLVKTNPPLRSRKDREALWSALKKGTIDLIATDHAPHTRESKETNIWDAPAGAPGLETMLPLLLNAVNKGSISLEKIGKLTSENPARIFRIKNKGRIEAGFDADLTVVDMKMKKTVRDDELFTKCGWSPFSGKMLKGWPVMTFIRGDLVYDNGNVNKIKGREVSYDQFTR